MTKTPESISPELREFLASWLRWAENGAYKGRPYHRSFGLCTNADIYGEDVTGSPHASSLRCELLTLFDGAEYPFGLQAYIIDGGFGTQHLNADRLAWVRAALQAECK